MSHHHTGGENVGEKIGSNIRGVFTGLHGTGDVVRGNMMGAVDSLFHDREAQRRDEEIVNKGQHDVRDEDARLRELRDGHGQATGSSAGQTPTGTEQSQPQQQQQQLHEHHHVNGKVTGAGSHFH